METPRDAFSDNGPLESNMGDKSYVRHSHEKMIDEIPHNKSGDQDFYSSKGHLLLN